MSRSLIWPLLAVLVSGLAVATVFVDSIRPAASAERPVFVAPADIDLGRRSVGEIISSEVTFQNPGSTTLELTNIRSDCACSGLEAVSDTGVVESLTELSIPAGESRPTRVRLIVRGRIGASQTSTIQFETNDPAAPSAQVRVFVTYIKNGLIVLPADASFGRVRVGETVTRELYVYDDAISPADSVSVIAPTDPRVSVALLSPDVHKPPADQPSYGTYMGCARVTITGSSIGAVNDRFWLAAAGREPGPAPILCSAQIRSPVECVPDQVLFQASDATLSMPILVRAIDGQLLSVKSVTSPAGFSLTPAEGPAERVVVPCHFTWERTSFENAAVGTSELVVPVIFEDGTESTAILKVQKINSEPRHAP